jgi:hypothetical protein
MKAEHTVASYNDRNFTSKIATLCETVSKCIHGLASFRKNTSYFSTLHRTGSNQVSSLHRACFGDSFVRFEHGKILHERHSTKPNASKSSLKMIFLIFFTMRLACIVTGFQPIELFCLRIYFGQTWLNKAHDFGQIQTRLTKIWTESCKNWCVSIKMRY